MSRSNKARYSTRTKRRKQRTSPTYYKGGWKDSMGKSRSQVRSRAKWKKATRNSTKKTVHSRVPQTPRMAYDRHGNEVGLYWPMEWEFSP